MWPGATDRVIWTFGPLLSKLAKDDLTEAFRRLAPSAQKEHVRQVTTAKAEATRQRRIAKAVDAAKAKA